MKLDDLFTEEEVEEIRGVYDSVNRFILSGTQDSAYFFKKVLGNPLLRDYFTKEFSGKRIIELGAGTSGLITLTAAHQFRDLGAVEYVGVDCVYEQSYLDSILPRNIGIPVQFVSSDGLSYLLGQSDESAVVFSSSFFVTQALSQVGLSPQLERKYIAHLIQQIGKVTSRGDVSVHVNGVVNPEEIGSFNSAGFKIELFNIRDSDYPRERKNHKTLLNYDFCLAVDFGGGGVFRKGEKK